MKLARFRRGDVVRLGRVDGDRITDISAAAPEAGSSMRKLLSQFPDPRVSLKDVSGPSHALSEVHLEAPINDPQKFLAIGMNFKAHAAESAAAGIAVPKSQLWFNKQVSCITGPYDPVDLPFASEKLDYEAELAFVIGRRCRHVPAEKAKEVIAGYMICNDVTTRDWQQRSPTFTLGKSFDTHGPIGPWITTPDELGDPHKLELVLWVNGEERQRSLADDMIYNIWEQVAYLSTVMTLEPGDVIATGTPSGVGIASNRYLKPGDVMRVEITGLGAIENKVVAEEPAKGFLR